MVDGQDRIRVISGKGVMDAMRAKVSNHLRHVRKSAIQESVLIHRSTGPPSQGHSDPAVVVIPKPMPELCTSSTNIIYECNPIFCFRIPFVQLLSKLLKRSLGRISTLVDAAWFSGTKAPCAILQLSAFVFNLHLDSYLPKTKTLNVPGSIGRSGCWLTGVGAGAGPNSDEET